MKTIDEIENYGLEHDVPIIKKEALIYIKNYIKENNIKNILEIGSAIGYSALSMASVAKDIKVTTIEIDNERANICKQNITDLKMEDQVIFHHMDALEFKTEEKYDLIFIDAAKAKNQRFFDLFLTNLADDGTIIVDNLYFYGLVDDMSQIKSRNLKQLVKKIKKFRDHILNDPNFITNYLQIGDGIALIKKKNC